MTDTPGATQFLQVLREEFLPYLQKCRDPEELPQLLDRLAGYLGADGAILWRAEDKGLLCVASYGCVEGRWVTDHANDSAGANALAASAAVLDEPHRGPYAAAISGTTLTQVASFPIRGLKGQAGAVEFWWIAGGGKPAPVEEILPLLEDALNQAMPPLLEYEAERRNYLSAISRLMMLYDIGKVFHSTLELNELAPLIVDRMQSIAEAESAALWLLDPVQKNLYCPAALGPAREQTEATRVWASDPGLGEAVSQGEFTLLNDVDDPAWTARWGSPIRSLMAGPLMQEGRFLGALEAVRGANSARFTDDELRLLMDVAKQASTAIRNAQRLQAERRVKELNALMDISQEITATLDLDRVLTTTVNRITSVIPAERCSVSLIRAGVCEVRAISGEMKVERKTAAVQELNAMHAWLVGLGSDFTIEQTEAGIETDREETRQKFLAYFERTGMRELSSLLLRDEEGVLGVLVLESKDTESLTPASNDLARIFANQVSVALRNALLYQQVPLIGVLHPIIQKKAKFSQLPAARRGIILGSGAVLLSFLVFFPSTSKPAGEARVLPARVQPVSAEVEGVVRRVLVQEGERVEAGQLLAELAQEEPAVALEQARTQHEILSRHVLQLESEGNLGSARIERARLQQAAAELDWQRTRLARTQIRSPLAGVVITPRLEERVGQNLRPGDVFCQAVELEKAWVEVAIPEQDIGEIQPGQEAWLKLNAFPARKVLGKVIRISPQGRELNKERVFDVIVEVPNEDLALRTGMMGRGKILAQRASIGYLILRVPVRWIWLKLWNWMP